MCIKKVVVELHIPSNASVSDSAPLNLLYYQIQRCRIWHWASLSAYKASLQSNTDFKCALEGSSQALYAQQHLSVRFCTAESAVLPDSVLPNLHTFQWNCSIPHGPPDLRMAQSTRATQRRPKGWLYPFRTARLKHVLYLYHTGQPRLYCSGTIWLGWGMHCTCTIRVGQSHRSPYHIYHLPIW